MGVESWGWNLKAQKRTFSNKNNLFADRAGVTLTQSPGFGILAASFAEVPPVELRKAPRGAPQVSTRCGWQAACVGGPRLPELPHGRRSDSRTPWALHDRVRRSRRDGANKYFFLTFEDFSQLFQKCDTYFSGLFCTRQERSGSTAGLAPERCGRAPTSAPSLVNADGTERATVREAPGQ